MGTIKGPKLGWGKFFSLGLFPFFFLEKKFILRAFFFSLGLSVAQGASVAILAEAGAGRHGWT